MLALFAVGVVTGTILSFELGLAVAGVDTGLRERVRPGGSPLRGSPSSSRPSSSGSYAYGWDRLSPRAHFLSGIPVAIAGVAGSLFVIAVNGWMNHPSGFTLVDGKATDVHPWSALFATRCSGASTCTCTSPPTSCAGSCSPEAYDVGVPARAARPVRADRA